MKVRDVMTADPVCCLPTDSAQSVARKLRDEDVGSMPVVADQDSRRLVGMITDRDLCCSVIADGLDPKSTSINGLYSDEPISCREGVNVNECERLMQEHQVRRIPIVDGDGRVIGIVAQADLALQENAEKVKKTVAEISKPGGEQTIAA